MTGPVGRRLADGRLHFQHGPIDLIIAIDGPAAAVELAQKRAWARFQTILDELVSELPVLRRPLQHLHPPPCGEGRGGGCADPSSHLRTGSGDTLPTPTLDPSPQGGGKLSGKVALAMEAACLPFADRFITPMAAVAGAVADEILASMMPAPPLRRVMINNGGDIAFYLSEGEAVSIGLAARPEDLALAGTIDLSASDPTRGVATSGWRGRSQSLGIANAVTVLATTAAKADAAATMIANEVNVDHPAIARRPAHEVKDDSDLGALPVTVAVGPLPESTIAQALVSGEAEAMRLLQAGLIHGAVLLLQGQIRVIGTAEHRSARVPAPCP